MPKEADELLLLACREKNLEKMRKAVEEGKAIHDAEYADHSSPLKTLAENGFVEGIHYLLNTFKDKISECEIANVLYLAIKHHQYQIIHLLIKEKINCTKVSGKDADHSDSLMFAAKIGDLEALKILIKKGGIDVYSSTDSYIVDYSIHPYTYRLTKTTALHIAAQHGHLHVLKYLIIEEGYEYDLTNVIGETPLKYAIYGGQLECTIFLMGLGATIGNFKLAEYCSNRSGYSSYSSRSDLWPLHHCAHRGDLNMLKFLLSPDAKPLLLPTKRTPKVSYYKHEDYYRKDYYKIDEINPKKTFTYYGQLFVDELDAYQRTPLMLALTRPKTPLERKNEQTCANFLLSQGADLKLCRKMKIINFDYLYPNPDDSALENTLYRAAHFHDIENLKLLSTIIPPDSLTPTGANALHHISPTCNSGGCRYGGYPVSHSSPTYTEYFETISFLKKNGASLEARYVYTSPPRNYGEPPHIHNYTPFLQAVLFINSSSIEKNILQAVKAFLDLGADINAQDDYGNTALHFLNKDPYLKAIELLFAYHPDVTLENKEGISAFHGAIRRDNEPLLRLYLEHLQSLTHISYKDKKGVLYLTFAKQRVRAHFLLMIEEWTLNKILTNAKELLETHAYQAVISCCEEGLEIRAEYIELLVCQGQAYLNLSDLEMAARCFKKILTFFPTHSNAQAYLKKIFHDFYRQGMFAKDAGQYTQAIDYLTNARRIGAELEPDFCAKIDEILPSLSKIKLRIQSSAYLQEGLNLVAENPKEAENRFRLALTDPDFEEASIALSALEDLQYHARLLAEESVDTVIELVKVSSMKQPEIVKQHQQELIENIRLNLINSGVLLHKIATPERRQLVTAISQELQGCVSFISRFFGRDKIMIDLNKYTSLMVTRPLQEIIILPLSITTTYAMILDDGSPAPRPPPFAPVSTTLPDFKSLLSTPGEITSDEIKGSPSLIPMSPSYPIPDMTGYGSLGGRSFLNTGRRKNLISLTTSTTSTSTTYLTMTSSIFASPPAPSSQSHSAAGYLSLGSPSHFPDPSSFSPSPTTNSESSTPPSATATGVNSSIQSSPDSSNRSISSGSSSDSSSGSGSKSEEEKEKSPQYVITTTTTLLHG